MMKKSKINKNSGDFHTPLKLAQYMTGLMRDVANQYSININSILDPAMGDGDLLAPSMDLFPHTKLYGTDINRTMVDRGNQRFRMQSTNAFDFKVENYLSTSLTGSIYSPKFDAMIANPPYVRTQNMLSGDLDLAQRYHLPGHLDLYQIFIVAMTKRLKKGGILCMITPNRYLFTKTGTYTRQFLQDNYQILDIIDLGDTDLFSADILPAIFIGIKRDNPANRTTHFITIYRENHPSHAHVHVSHILDALQDNRLTDNSLIVKNHQSYQIHRGTMKLPDQNDTPWALTSIDNIRWADQLMQKNLKFKDIFDIHVGIKTNADSVFIHNDWGSLPNADSRLLHPLIASNNIERWNSPLSANPRTILYPYVPYQGRWKVINLKDFPATKTYLNYFKTRLSQRKYLINAGKRWYELWVTQNPQFMQKPKVVFPDISNVPKFTLDLKGRMVDGNCYWLTLKPGMPFDYLYLAVILANSKIFQKMHHIKYNNRLYSGKNRYFAQYIKDYPIPDIKEEATKKLINICKEIINRPNHEEHYLHMYELINQLIKDSLI